MVLTDGMLERVCDPGVIRLLISKLQESQAGANESLLKAIRKEANSSYYLGMYDAFGAATDWIIERCKDGQETSKSGS